MSDFSIPGTGTSKYGTDKIIEGLMKLERIPRDKAAEKLKQLQDLRAVWLDFNQRLNTVRTGAMDLYSFKNPFFDRLAKSSNEDSVSATATREALEQTRTILVKQAAAADRFVSSELPKDFRVPAGTYGFSVGAKSLEVKFAGGSLQEFVDAINRKGNDLIRAQVVVIRPDTKSLVVESLVTGAANRLGFQGDAEHLALDAGLVEKIQSTLRQFDISHPQPWSTGLDPNLVQAGAPAAKPLTLVAGGEARLPLAQPAKAGGLVLELEYRLVKLPEQTVPQPPPGPSLPPVGQVTYEGITVTGAPNASGLPDWSPPALPARVEDRIMANLIGSDGKAVALPELQDGDGIQKLTVRVGDYLPEAAGLGFRVRDTTRRLEVVSARLVDPAESGGYRPLHPVATAQDAVVSVDGIEATRPTNAISDMIPGVTLSVKSPSDKPVQLKIEPDREAVKNAIIAFVGNYNRLMAQINILSSKDENIIPELTYFTDAEKQGAKDHLGILQGDSTMNLLRSALSRVMTSSYETKDGQAMALLSQLGIATDSRKPGSGQGYDASKMRGYLEIDEDTLKKALLEHFEAARQLFGNDASGTLIIDSGVAFNVASQLKPYVETGGIISLKTGTIDSQIKTTQTTIASLDVQLAAKEQDLKVKYGQMESALNQMQGTSNSIDQFAKNGGQ